MRRPPPATAFAGRFIARLRPTLILPVLFLPTLMSQAQAEALVNIQQPGVIPGALSPPGFGTANPSTTPQLPGTITVRLDARVVVNLYAGYDTGRNATVTPVAGAAASAAGTGLSLGSPAANTKLASYSIGSFVRLYPQFAGVAANGLKYGAFAEIRQENASPPGGGANGGVSASDRTRGQLYFRREYVYLGTDAAGFVRLGATDQPTSLFITGTAENFDDAGWNGDMPYFFTTNAQPTYPFPDVGAVYSTEKLVYLSPRLAGFDVGLSFEPNSGTGNSGPGNCPYGVTSSAGLVTTGVGGASALGCDAASSTTSGDNARRRNTLDSVLRYRQAFGPVGLTVTAGGMLGGRVLDNSTPSKAVQLNNLAVADGGVQLVVGGLTVGGHVDYGKFNGQYNLSPQHTTDSLALIGGASYAVGPVIFGASYFDFLSPGSKTAVSAAGIGNRHEYGLAVGSTYQLTQGVFLFASGVYGGRHELGVDLLSGATGTAATPVRTNNNTRALGALMGTMFKW